MLEIRNVSLYTGEDFIPEGKLIIDGSYIKYAGPEKGAPEYSGKSIDGEGGLVIPGLVNAHCHAAMTLMRGLGSDLSLINWLGRVVPIEQRLTPEMIKLGSQLAIMEMLSTGTTAFADMYFSLDSIAEAVYESGIRATICRGSSDIAGVNSHEDYIRRWHGIGDGRIRMSIGVHAVYTSTPEVVERAASLAKKYDLTSHVHISETYQEVEDCRKKYGCTPVEYFYRGGLFNGPCIAAHMVYPEQTDVEILRECGVYVAHCPASNLKLASGIAPVTLMGKNDIKICIGTDGAASSNSLDMFRQMWLASLLQKGTTLNAESFKVADVIKASTMTGALALGFDDVGLLKQGMRADLVLLKSNCSSMIPDHDPVSNVVYSASGGDVRMTMVNGDILYQDGSYTHIDAERVIAHFCEIVKKIGG